MVISQPEEEISAEKLLRDEDTLSVLYFVPKNEEVTIHSAKELIVLTKNKIAYKVKGLILSYPTFFESLIELPTLQ